MTFALIKSAPKSHWHGDLARAARSCDDRGVITRLEAVCARHPERGLQAYEVPAEGGPLLVHHPCIVCGLPCEITTNVYLDGVVLPLYGAPPATMIEAAARLRVAVRELGRAIRHAAADLMPSRRARGSL